MQWQDIFALICLCFDYIRVICFDWLHSSEFSRERLVDQSTDSRSYSPTASAARKVPLWYDRHLVRAVGVIPIAMTMLLVTWYCHVTTLDFIHSLRVWHLLLVLLLLCAFDFPRSLKISLQVSSYKSRYPVRWLCCHMTIGFSWLWHQDLTQSIWDQ